jgi:hypothetical protein
MRPGNFIIHGYLEPSAQNNPAFLSFVDQGYRAGIRTRLPLLKDLQRSPTQTFADLTVRDASLSYFD